MVYAKWSSHYHNYEILLQPEEVSFAVTCYDEDGIEYISGKKNIYFSRMKPGLTKPAMIANTTLFGVCSMMNIYNQVGVCTLQNHI